MAKRRSSLVIGLGEVLWDLLPQGPQIGGAPSNFAWMATQLGMNGRLVSAVGADPEGTRMISELKRRGMGTDHISIIPDHPTGTVSVVLDKKGKPTYEIHESVAWDFIPALPEHVALAEEAVAVCLGTLAQRSTASHSAIQEFLDATSAECLQIFDLNLRQKQFPAEVIRETLTKCQVLKLNDEEWTPLARELNLSPKFETGLLELRDRYGLRVIALTRGDRGSVLVSPEGVLFADAVRTTVVDTVGAGDAFTAALAVGLVKETPLPEIHQRANEVAAFVCSRPGATPKLPDDLKY